MNDVKSLQAELVVECNRPRRNEHYISWLKTIISLAIYANQKFERAA